MVLNRKRDGSTLLVTAGVHGREVSGIGALHDALKQMDVARTSGRAIAISVAIALAATWVGLFVAFYTPYPVSFFITGIVFGLYLLVRLVGRALKPARAQLLPSQQL